MLREAGQKCDRALKQLVEGSNELRGTSPSCGGLL